MKMKKADEAHAAKADKMRHPQWAEYSGWPPENAPVVTTSKLVAKAKKVVAEIVAPLDEADGDSN